MQTVYSEGPAAPQPALRSPHHAGWVKLVPWSGSDLAQGNREVLRQLEGGADGVWLRAAPLLSENADWRQALAGVLPEAVALHLDGGELPLGDAVQLLAWLRHSGADAAACRLDLGLDPLAALARTGSLVGGMNAAFRQGAHLLDYVEAELPLARVFRIDTSGYHLAGASEIQELACAAASLVETLRGALAIGVSPQRVAERCSLRLAVGPECFLEIAKLRAARLLWRRILEAAEVEPPDAQIHALTSARTLSRRDPWVNLLRGTTQCFAAILGGADAITVLPFDHALGGDRVAGMPPDAAALGRRLARNTQLVLDQEAQLGKVQDPAAGSYAIESLTRDLAAAAWSLFQEIESEGGMAAALQHGGIGRRLQQSRARRAEQLATREQRLTGVSAFADLEESLHHGTGGVEGGADTGAAAALDPALVPVLPADHLVQAAITALEKGTPAAALEAALRSFLPNQEALTMEALPWVRDAEVFEGLRARGEALAAGACLDPVTAPGSGGGAVVHLVPLDGKAENHAGVSFCAGLLAVAGVRSAVTLPGQEVPQGIPALVCLCLESEAGVSQVLEGAAQWRARGVRQIMLASTQVQIETAQGQAWAADGVAPWLRPGADAVAALDQVLSMFEEAAR